MDDVLNDPAIVARAQGIVDRYEPLDPAATEPAAVKVKPRWSRILKFPISARRFERVFDAQGEPFVARWILAFRMARVTIAKTKSHTPPTAENPSTGANAQGSGVPSAGLIP